MKKTKGRIPAIVSTVPALARLVALNAIYFNGRWWQPFDRKWTCDGLFTTAAGTEETGSDDVASRHLLYYEDRSLQAVVLPYKGGVNMYVILPVQVTDAKQFQPVLTADAWSGGWLDLRGRRNSSSARFKLDFDAQLDPRSRRWEWNEYSTGTWRNSKASAANHLRYGFDQILHRAVVEVNERGTEAAAVTSL